MRRGFFSLQFAWRDSIWTERTDARVVMLEASRIYPTTQRHPAKTALVTI